VRTARRTARRASVPGVRVAYNERWLARACGLEWDAVSRQWTASTVERAELFVRAKSDPVVASWYDASPGRIVEVDAGDIEAPEGRAYFPFQIAGIAYALRRFRVLDALGLRGGVLIADEMGLGKTVEVAGIINALAPARVLVVAPAVMRLVWAEELQRWLVGRHDYLIDVVQPGERWVEPVSAQRSLFTPHASVGRVVRIMSYEGLVAAEQQACVWAPDLVVFDEGHYVRNPRAQRTTAARAVAHAAKRVVVLTGTPVVNRPADAFIPLSLVAPELFRSRAAYLKRYCGGDMTGRENIGTNLEELSRLLRLCMVRRTKAEVATELPPKIRQAVVFDRSGFADLIQREYELVGKARAEYRRVMSEAEWKARAREVEMRLLANLSEVRHAIALRKAPLVAEHVEMLLEDTDKVVVFAHHRDVLDELAATFGSSAVMVRGGMSDGQKSLAVARFQSDPSVRVFLGSILAAGTGITLTSASTVVFAELDWVPGNMAQAEDRCHRVGQLNPVTVQMLVVDGSIDALIARKLAEKHELITETMRDHAGTGFVIRTLLDQDVSG
jgi:SWI/SNF-related matrix-associated actin-dependent regulator 1 of chromatin subfamily A